MRNQRRDCLPLKKLKPVRPDSKLPFQPIKCQQRFCNCCMRYASDGKWVSGGRALGDSFVIA